MNAKDVMLDLETTGVNPGCGILSIGATTFDLEKSYYVKIDNASCIALGLVNEPSTMAWWAKQNPAAREEAFSGRTPIRQALVEFFTWYSSINRDKKATYIWGNGADFDLPILKAAYSLHSMDVPWSPFNGRCYRTLKNLYHQIQPDSFEGVKHTALADAIHQAKHARKILRAHFCKE